jgi:hypothetical protein
VKSTKRVDFFKRTDKILTMKTYNYLATAVLVVIDTFRLNSQDFSAWDVTKELRRLTNDGVIDISEAPQTFYNGAPSRDISHANVRDLIHELSSHNLIQDFRKEFSGGGGFYVYRFQAAASKAPVLASFVATVQAPVVSSNTVVAVATPTRKLSQAVVDRINSYVNRKQAVGLNPTLKQVQSALKGTQNLTVSQIADVVSNAGYNLIKASPFYASQVS